METAVGVFATHERAEEVVRLGFDEVQHANFLMLNFMDSVKDTRSMARFTAVAQHGAELDLGSQRVRYSSREDTLARADGAGE